MKSDDFENLTRALEGALPPASILSFVENVRRLTPERRREVGRIIFGAPKWNDWLPGVFAGIVSPKFGPGRVEIEHPPCENLASPALRGKKPIAAFIDEMVELPPEAPSAGFLASGRKKGAFR